MTAYIVFTREKTRDQAELDTYTRNARHSVAGHDLTILVGYGKTETLEGAPTEGMVIVSFPTFEEAKAWYDSPIYAEARQHRFLGADYRAILVEGRN